MTTTTPSPTVDGLAATGLVTVLPCAVDAGFGLRHRSTLLAATASLVQLPLSTSTLGR